MDSLFLFLLPGWFLFTLSFIYKQPVYKQLAFEWQIAKELLGLSPFPLSNNKNCRLKKSGVLPL